MLTWPRANRRLAERAWVPAAAAAAMPLADTPAAMRLLPVA